MKLFAKQCLRGMGTLPGVGEHPGMLYIVGFPLVASLVTIIENGVISAFIVGGMFLAFLLPFYLIGAYERAKLSDHIVRQRRGN